MNKAKNFFVHLGAMISLYVTVILSLVLYFAIINVATESTYYLESELSAMRFSISGLFVSTIILVVLSRILGSMYRQNIEYVESAIKKWLSYITVFITSIALAIDVVILIYNFLNGDATMAFVLKSLSVMVVAGIALSYSLYDIKRTDYINIVKSKVYAGVLFVFVIVGMITGFMYAGNPEAVRMQKRDAERIQHLNNMENGIQMYFNSNKVLPQSIDDISNPLSGIIVPIDPKGFEYSYTIKGVHTYELCAEFETDTTNNYSQGKDMYMQYGNVPHTVGKNCFDRKVYTEDVYKGIPVSY